MAESLGPGLTFAGCRIEKLAGRGGMGVVYEATQLALQRPVALKAIAPALAADPDFRARFERESQLTASLDHPNVIPVYDAGELDGTLYLVMRWVDGTDLRTLLDRSGALSPERAIKLLQPVAAALAAAHRRGLVHRDVKPANVLVARGEDGDEDGHVYLTDFGIARRTDGESVTRTGVFVGTVDYAAPERFQRGRGDAASDIYSLGCVLFEAVTGQVPYDRPSTISTIHAHMTEPVPSAHAIVAAVPEQLDAIVATAMAKRPEDRYRSAADFAAALGQALFALEGAVRGACRDHRPRRSHRLAGPAGPTGRADGRDRGSHRPAPSPPPPRSATTAAGPHDQPVAESPAPPRRRGSLVMWVAPIVVLSLIVVLIATFSDNPPTVGKTSRTGASTQAQGTAGVTLQGGGLRLGTTIPLAGLPGGVSIGKKNVWTSVPDAGQLVRWNLTSGAHATFPATGGPTSLSAGFRALWVAQPAADGLAQYNGDAGTQVAMTKLPGSPVATVFDQKRRLGLGGGQERRHQSRRRRWPTRRDGGPQRPRGDGHRVGRGLAVGRERGCRRSAPRQPGRQRLKHGVRGRPASGCGDGQQWRVGRERERSRDPIQSPAAQTHRRRARRAGTRCDRRDGSQPVRLGAQQGQ